MIPEILREKERALRRAVERRAYDGLRQQLEAFRAIADTHIAALPAGDPRRTEIASWMLATVEWASLMLTTQRQIWSGELARLPLVGKYASGRPCQTKPSVCLDL
jgi:hypothetical protein